MTEAIAERIVNIIYGLAFVLPALFCISYLFKLALKRKNKNESKIFYTVKSLFTVFGILYFAIVSLVVVCVFVLDIPLFQKISSISKAILFILFILYCGTVGGFAIGLGYLGSGGVSPSKTMKNLSKQVNGNDL